MSARPEQPTACQGPNPNRGRDLVIGDRHGHFPTLEAGRFAGAVRTNHEQMMADAFANRASSSLSQGASKRWRGWMTR